MRMSRDWLVQLAGLGLAFVVATASFAKDEPGDELVQMIVKLVSDSDKDLRAVGLEQVRTEAKGTAATKQFASQLPRLPAAGQVALLSALADRGDAAALPAVVELLGSNRDPSVRVALLRALGSLGGETELPLLLNSLSADSAGEKSAARSALRRLRGEGVPGAIAKAMKDAPPAAHIALVEVLTSRRALNTLGSILADAKGDNAEVRRAAMAALGQLAAAEHVPGMLEAVLKSQQGAERETAEKAVALVCSRSEDPEQRAIVAAWSKFNPEERIALLSTLGRVGGKQVYVVVKESMQSVDKQHADAGLRALSNWPDATIADELFSLAQKADGTSQRSMLFNAFVRLSSQRDGRTDLQRLARMKQAMSIAKSDEERRLAINRARTSYSVESLRFAMPYLDKPEFAQVACETIVELAHHREVREPNKAEFDPALDRVIKLSRDEVVVERAGRYKRGETWERPKPPEAANAE